MDKVRSVAVFVRSHRRVKSLYLTVCKIPTLGGGRNGTMLKLFPDTRFSYRDLMIQQFLDNKYYLKQTILHEDFEDICQSITAHKVNEFRDIVQPSVVSDNRYFDHKAFFLHNLTKLVCKLIHHVEQRLCKVSWINALFFALMDDFDEWSNDIQVQNMFDTDFIEAVHQALMNRWRGEREGVTGRGRNTQPFQSKVWNAAAIFDPYYAPTEDAFAAAINDEVLDYVGSVQNLMQPYFSEDNIKAQMIEMRAEVNQIVLRRWHWGDLIRSFQRSIATPPRTNLMLCDVILHY